MREFWQRFFQNPLQLRLEQDGKTIERLAMYIMIHHDHHFICAWGSESFSEGLQFDGVRRIVEWEYDDLYKWLHQDSILRSDFRCQIITIGHLLDWGHSWSLALAREVW